MRMDGSYKEGGVADLWQGFEMRNSLKLFGEFL